MWDDISALKNLSAWLQLIAIILVFTGGMTQIGRFFVDRRKDELSSSLQKKQSDPREQAIRTATAKLVVNEKSSVPRNNRFMDRGAVLAFGKAGAAIMTMTSIDSFANSKDNSEVVWSANVSLDAQDLSMGQPVYFLRDAEVLEFEFLTMDKKTNVLGGSVIITINNAVRLEITIPPQQIENGVISTGALDDMRQKLLN